MFFFSKKMRFPKSNKPLKPVEVNHWSHPSDSQEPLTVRTSPLRAVWRPSSLDPFFSQERQPRSHFFKQKSVDEAFTTHRPKGMQLLDVKKFFFRERVESEAGGWMPCSWGAVWIPGGWCRPQDEVEGVDFLGFPRCSDWPAWWNDSEVFCLWVYES